MSWETRTWRNTKAGFIKPFTRSHPSMGLTELLFHADIFIENGYESPKIIYAVGFKGW
jgi:hypothetical protein